MKKTILTESFTTTGARQFWNSFLFLNFKLPFIRKWFKKEQNRKKLANSILNFLELKNSKIYFFYNWRTAIYKLIKSLDIKENDEVIINAYNCISVVNSVIQASAKPIYVDIDSSNLSFDTEKLEKKINKKTKLIILQHTFWKTANIKKTIEIAKKYNIPVLEDIAHSFGSSYKWKKHWTFWDFAMISTWRDKVISSVNWWLLVINNKEYFDKLKEIEKDLILPFRKLVLRNLQYNLIWLVSYKTYDFFSLWKAIMHFSRKLQLIPDIICDNEKKCCENKLSYSMPNSLVVLATKEMQKIEKYISYRKKIALIYDEKLNFKYFKKAFQEDREESMNYFRYPIVFESAEIAEKYYNYMRKNNIILWNSWSWKNIAPKTSCLESAKYNEDCKNAEELAQNILLLPNSKNTNIKDTEKIINLSNNFEI